MKTIFAFIVIHTAQINAQFFPRANFNATFPNLMRLASVLVALLSVLFVAIGGFKYVISNGDPQSITKAKDTILYALVGLAIGVSAYTIMSFVIGRL